MSQITVMSSQNQLPAVGGGSEIARLEKITSPKVTQIKATKELLLAKTKEYLNSDCCISCVYFTLTKGHFGFCNAALDSKNNPKNRYYDGTKKGTGCSLWRTDIIIPESVTITKQERFKEMRESYTKERRIKRIHAIIKRHNKYANYNLLPELRVFKGGFEFSKIRDLPNERTSELHSFKRAYYGHRFHKSIMEYAFTLIQDTDLSYRKIELELKKKFNVRITHHTVMDWNKRFFPQIERTKGRKHDDEWKEKIRKGVILQLQTTKQGKCQP